MIIRNLWRRKTRTILTLLGITVGIAAIVSLVALSRGIATSYVEVTNRSGADVIVQALQGEGQAITIGTGFDEAVLERIRALPEVRSASGMLYALARAPGVPFFIVFGYEPDGAGIQRFKVIEGVSLAEHRTRRGGKPILLGTVAADKLHKRVGDTVLLEDGIYRVVGIFETGVAMEDSAGVMALRDAQALANMPRQVMYVGIQLHNPQRADAFKERLQRILPDDVEVAGTTAGSQMLEMLEMLDVFAWGVAAIAALVGGVGMMNTMLMSVLERTREIGVLRAVGWRPRQVLRMILGESLLLSLIGGLLGLGAGAGITTLAAATPAMAGLTGGTVPPTLIVQALVTALVLGAVGGVYPAWRASRLPPVEALSYDGGSGRGGVVTLPVGGMALRGLLRQRGRTSLTMLGLGIGVLSIILMASLGEGATHIFGGLFAGTEITAVEKDQPDTSLSVIDERDLRRIEALPEVQYVTGMVFGVVATPSNPFFMITGRSRTDPMLQERNLREGRLLAGPRECLLGWKGAADQNRGVGDTIALLGTRFTVVGIVETGNTFEDSGAIIPLREAQRLLKKPNQVMVMQVKLRDATMTDAMVERLSQEYPKLLFSRSAELVEGLPDMESTNQMIGGVTLLTVLISAIVLANTMVMSVYERTREIGVLRAVGWGRVMVLRQVMVEALLLTLMSGLVGLVGAYAVVWGIRVLPVPALLQDMWIIVPRIVVQSLAICVVLGVIGGLYPAWRATTLSPVEALRYE